MNSMNTSFCGSWCKYIKLPEEQWQTINVQTGCKLCNKIMDAHMYLEAKAVHEQFTTTDNLQMLNHEFDSCQKNEAMMNKAFYISCSQKYGFFQIKVIE